MISIFEWVMQLFNGLTHPLNKVRFSQHEVKDAHLEKGLRLMKPKFNKLITLLLLLGTFAFLKEAEQRISLIAQKELSEWASLLPVENEQKIMTINPYRQNISLVEVLLITPMDQKTNPTNN